MRKTHRISTLTRSRSHPLKISPAQEQELLRAAASCGLNDMMPELPEKETARLMALYRYQILDTDPEQAFDDLANLAADVCSTPMASISLVDRTRVWFKAQVGWEFSQMPRSVAFCTYTIKDKGLIVPDTLLDSRFVNNPLVTSDPGIRFYAAVSLTNSEGYAIGAIGVMDRQPREIGVKQVQRLEALGRSAIAQLELRQHKAIGAKSAAKHQETQAALRMLERKVAQQTAQLVSLNERLLAQLNERKYMEQALRVSHARLAEILAIADDAIISVDASQRIILFNQGAEKIFGYSAAEVLNQPMTLHQSHFTND